MPEIPVAITRLDVKAMTRAQFDEASINPLVSREPVWIIDEGRWGFLCHDGEETATREVAARGVMYLTQDEFTAMGLGAAYSYPPANQLMHVYGVNSFSPTEGDTVLNELWLSTGPTTLPICLTRSNETFYMLYGGDASSALAVAQEGSDFIEMVPAQGISYNGNSALREVYIANKPGMQTFAIYGLTDIPYCNFTPCKKLHTINIQGAIPAVIVAANLLELDTVYLNTPFTTEGPELGGMLFINCPQLDTIDLTGFALASGVINQILGDLPDRTGKTAGTITVTDATNLSGMNTALATARNWNVVDES